MTTYGAANLTADLRKTVMPVTIFFGFEIVIGIIGNLLTIYVFLCRYKPCNFRYFVLSLAVIDLVACLTTIPGEMVSQLFWYTYPVPPVCKIKAYFNQFTVLCEAAFLFLIALDRYRKVCRPFQWQLQHRTAKVACLAIYVVSGLFMIQTPILWGVHTEINNGTHNDQKYSTNVTVCEKDEAYKDTDWPLANVLLVGAIDSVAVVLMLAMYTRVALKIRDKQRQLRHRIRMTTRTMEESSDTNFRTDSMAQTSDIASAYNQGTTNNAYNNTPSSQNSPTELRETPDSEENRRSMLILRARRKSMMGFILTLIFVVTTILYWCLISFVAKGILSEIDGVAKVFFFFFLRLIFINHIINPILYGLMDPQFRKEMRNLRKLALKMCAKCSRT